MFKNKIAITCVLPIVANISWVSHQCWHFPLCRNLAQGECLVSTLMGDNPSSPPKLGLLVLTYLYFSSQLGSPRWDTNNPSPIQRWEHQPTYDFQASQVMWCVNMDEGHTVCHHIPPAFSRVRQGTRPLWRETTAQICSVTISPLSPIHLPRVRLLWNLQGKDYFSHHST